MTRLLTLMLTIFFISCRMSYQDIYGTYELKNFPKTTIDIKADSTFIFTQNYPNPYLHPFPHSDEYYFKTKGKWHGVPGAIRLLGTGDSMSYNTVNILSTEPTTNNQSNFKFYDEFGDAVSILFVQYSDSSSVSVLHRTMEDFDEDLSQRDTLQFHFFGYQPWTFIQADRDNNNYRVELLPTFRPNEIDSLYFKLRRNVIGSKEFKFVKKKSI